MARIIIVWGLWGPYHCRRLEVFRQHAGQAGHEVIGVSLFSGSQVNQWCASLLPKGVVHFNLGDDETSLPVRHIGSLLMLPRKLRVDIALLPSYDHWSLVLNAGVRMAGGRVVMMNDTHGGTARARGFKAAFKQRVVAGFHSGFVAGSPQRRYFASLGLPMEKIFTGYDAVDNDYFAARADEIRSQKSEVRSHYDLPERYFLSLGRFVEKKNLTTLIQAYRKFLDSSQNCQTHLVIVGSGEEGPKLHSLCQELRLPAYDKTWAGIENRKSKTENEPPGVHFYGFRQIEENPVFYALADAFILPSLWEEWGLVANEAMASGLPVIVSETAGCAEDLLESSDPMESLPLQTLTQSAQMGLLAKARINGFVFNPKSSDELSRAMLILNASPGLRRAMGQASRCIVEKFSCENFARNALLAAQAAQATTR
jgi:glycosyltransferase involved in cell wall biosynthesis